MAETSQHTSGMSNAPTQGPPNPASSYRENPDRALFLRGPISPESIRALLPRAIELRKSTRPITVYIDSPGGNPVFAQNLLFILQSPDVDGECRRIITVALGQVASAAADFLTSGDYAIAYVSATIHLHGYRELANADDVLTMESAADKAARLQRDNDSAALEMAKSLVRRMSFLFLSHIDSFAKNPKATKTDKFHEFVAFLKTKVRTPAAISVLSSAATQLEESQQMTSFVADSLDYSDDDSALEMEVKMLKTIIDYELKRIVAAEQTEIDDKTLDTVTSDFKMLREVFTTTSSLRRHFGGLADLFLHDDEKEMKEKRKFADEAEEREWVIHQTRDYLKPMWFLSISICSKRHVEGLLTFQ